MDLTTFLTLRPVLFFLSVLLGCAAAATVVLRVIDPRPRRRWIRVLQIVFPFVLVAAGIVGYTLPRHRLLLGEHYLKRGQFAEAIAHLEAARALATPAEKAGAFARLRARLVNRAINSWGGMLELDTALGLAYAHTGQCSEARPLLDQVI